MNTAYIPLALGLGAAYLLTKQKTRKSAQRPPRRARLPRNLRQVPKTPDSYRAAALLAPSLAGNIMARGQSYDRRLLSEFQKHAGITIDGKYGGQTAGALAFFNKGEAPNPLFRPLKPIAFAPRYLA